MVRISEITDKLLNVVGWDKESYNLSDLDDSLAKSETGVYFQQAHALITLTNIKSIAPDFSKQSDQDTAFSEWLKTKTKASIAKAVLRFCDDKSIQNMSKPLIENKVLFDGTGRLVDTINNTSSLVGFEIVPVRAKGVTTKINKIGLQFTVPGTYKLYLMHSSSPEPIKTIELEKTKAGGLEWFDQTDLYLPYIASDIDAGGSWYLVYNQNELPEGSKAIYKQYDWSKGPCTWCSRRELETYRAWSRYLEIHPFKTAAPEAEVNMWDVETNLYTYDTNYGLNLDVSVECDITDFIIEQRSIFKNVILLQVATDIIRELAYNPNVRVNRSSLNASRTEILYELDGDSRSVRRSGLMYQLEQAFKALDFNTRGIDRICLSCKGSGLKYRTI